MNTKTAFWRKLEARTSKLETRSNARVRENSKRSSSPFGSFSPFANSSLFRISNFGFRNCRTLLVLLAFALFASSSFAQALTGTKNIPGDYATLEAAIADLNLEGVGAGGVTLNLVAGNPQTAPAGGYVVGGATSQVLTTSSAANPVIIQGNNNLITALPASDRGCI